MIRRCGHELTAPDILVNNAGIQFVSPVENFPVEKWEAILRINLTAVFHTTRLCLPAMRAERLGPDHQHRFGAQPGRLAPTSRPMSPPSMASPASPRPSRWKRPRDGVTVNCISPGYVWTPLVENQIPDTMKARGLTREQVMNDVLLAAQPTKRFVTVDEVASLALYLTSDGAASVTGANFQHGRRLDRSLG